MKSRPSGPVRWKISRQNQPTLRISEPMPYRKRSSSVLRALDKHLESSSSSLSNSSTPAKRPDLVNGFLRGSSWQAFFCVTKMKVSKWTAARPREPTLARPKKAGTIRCGHAVTRTMRRWHRVSTCFLALGGYCASRRNRLQGNFVGADVTALPNFGSCTTSTRIES
jgi:hypothetical protein